jgi:hypothetical protein
MKRRDLPGYGILGRAIFFVAKNLLTLLRLTWLPLVLLLAVQIVFGQLMLSHSAAKVTMHLLDWESQKLLLNIAAAVLQIIPLTVVATRVHRLVFFDDRRPGEYFVFPFGVTELRYIAAGLLTYVSVLGPAAALIAVIGITSTGSNAVGTVMVLLIAVYFLFLFVTLRLLILPAMVVATGHISLRDAILLTHRRAFSLFTLIVVAFLITELLGADAFDTQRALLNRPDVLGWLWFPDWSRFAEPPTPQGIAWEFGASFFITTFVVAVLSYTYLSLKELADEEDAAAAPFAHRSNVTA